MSVATILPHEPSIRRLPLALIDADAAGKAAPRVIEIMPQTLGWDDVRCQAEQELGAWGPGA